MFPRCSQPFAFRSRTPPVKWSEVTVTLVPLKTGSPPQILGSRTRRWSKCRRSWARSPIVYLLACGLSYHQPVSCCFDSGVLFVARWLATFALTGAVHRSDALLEVHQSNLVRSSRVRSWV